MEEATKAADFLFEGRLVSRDLAATHAIKFPDGSVENYLVSSDEWLGVIQKSLLEQCAGKLYLAENSRSEAGRERSRLAVYVTSPSEADNALVLPEVIRLNQFDVNMLQMVGALADMFRVHVMTHMRQSMAIRQTSWIVVLIVMVIA